MSNAPVVLVLESGASDPERIIFWNDVSARHENRYTFEIATDKESIAQKIAGMSSNRPAIVFAHKGDTRKYNEALHACNGSSGTALVLYSAGVDNLVVSGSVIDGLHFDSLKENIGNFLAHAATSRSVTEEELFVLVAIDAKLEKLLAPFATSSPFKAPSPGAKKELDTYIASLPKLKS